MPEIVPRWEWRTFGDPVAIAEPHFAGLATEREQESDEVYLLSRKGDASVKVRDDLMDVKRLQQVNDDGLEQWRPVLKASFPLGQADAAALFDALGVGAPQLGREAYTLEELVDELVRPDPDLRAVDVHKRRRHFTIGGAMAELSEVRADGKETRTIAVELDDPERVIAAVRELGLGEVPNVSFARGLKALVGFS